MFVVESLALADHETVYPVTPVNRLFKHLGTVGAGEYLIMVHY